MIYRVLYIPGGCLGFLPSTVEPKWGPGCFDWNEKSLVLENFDQHKTLGGRNTKHLDVIQCRWKLITWQQTTGFIIAPSWAYWIALFSRIALPNWCTYSTKCNQNMLVVFALQKNTALRTYEIRWQKWEIQNSASSTRYLEPKWRLFRLETTFLWSQNEGTRRTKGLEVGVTTRFLNHWSNHFQSPDLIVSPGGVWSKMAVWHELEMPSEAMEGEDVVGGGWGYDFESPFSPGVWMFRIFLGMILFI